MRGIAFIVAIMGFATISAAGKFDDLRVPPTQPSTAPALAPLGDVSSRAAWEARRQQLRAQWLEILGPMPQRVPLETQVLVSEAQPDHLRLWLRYHNDANSTNEAYLLIPRNGHEKRPAVVALHATSANNMRDPVGLSGKETNQYALHLVKRGYVCIVPKNYLWSVGGKTYQQAADDLLKRGEFKTGLAKMIWDAMRAVDVLESREEVDPKRIGAIGHSLGGKEAIYLAAFDERIAATISCEGGVALSFGNWDADWYLGKQIRPGFPHDNHEVVSLIGPRGFLLIGGESADGAKSWPYIEANLPVWKLYGAEDRLGLLRHTDGHLFPKPGKDRDRVYEWLDEQLGMKR